MMEYNFYASYPKGSEIRKGRVRRSVSMLGVIMSPMRSIFTRLQSDAGSHDSRGDA